jgi:signal transduction histidine kinase
MIRWTPSWGDLASDLATTPVGRPAPLTRFAVPARGPWFWAAAWFVVVVAEFLALVPVLFPSGPVEASDVVSRLLGGSFAACGLIAWRRRPDSRSGLLMLAAGAGFFVYPLLSQIEVPAVQTLAFLMTDIWILAFVALLLTILTGGRMRSRVDWLLVAAFALPLVVMQPLWMLFWEQPGNVLAIFPDPAIDDAIDKAQRSLAAIAALATALVIALRWEVASGPRRRAMLPSVAGAFALLLYASVMVNDLVTTERSGSPEPESSASGLLWLELAAMITVPAAFLFGLLRSRLARHGLVSLLLSLRDMHGEALQRALARALGDQSLRIAYAVPGTDAYVDAAGAPVVVPSPGGDRRVVLVERDGREVAALVYDAALDEDPELVEAVGAAAAIALEHEALHAESRARLTELRASRERLVTAADSERRRLERNLHDGAQQRLVALSLQLRLAQGRIRGDPDEAEELVTAARDELAQSLEELRELARGIHPAALNHGLASALDSLATRSPVPTAVSVELPERLPETIELAAYFVVSEALTNVAKYARATHASVYIVRADGVATVEVADDGIGGADEASGSGLRGLADRVETLGGSLHVTSPPGEGTVVTAELPVASGPMTAVTAPAAP